MQREQRLRSRRDFSAAYRSGSVQGNRLLVLRVRPNGTDVTRFGFAVGKVVGGAVVRNRVKRRLREAARALDVKPGLDVVIGARKPAAEAEFAALRDALAGLMRRSDALAPAGAAKGRKEST
jgi:ribonuclease P protein component